MNAQTYFFPTQIFRAYDIRGNVSLLTPHVIYAIAHGLAQQFKNAEQKQVVIGYDARLSSPYYAALMQDVLQRYDLDVVLIGCCSSPLMYSQTQFISYISLKLRSIASLMDKLN